MVPELRPQCNAVRLRREEDNIVRTAVHLQNRIQNLRKSSGYDITDKISVTVLSNDGMDEAIKDFNSYIANQVLAVSVEITDVISDATEMDFEDFKLSVRIEKA